MLQLQAGANASDLNLGTGVDESNLSKPAREDNPLGSIPATKSKNVSRVVEKNQYLD